MEEVEVVEVDHNVSFMTPIEVGDTYQFHEGPQGLATLVLDEDENRTFSGRFNEETGNFHVTHGVQEMEMTLS